MILKQCLMPFDKLLLYSWHVCFLLRHVLFSTGFCYPRIWRCVFQHCAKIKCECQDSTHWNSCTYKVTHIHLIFKNDGNGMKWQEWQSYLIHLSFHLNKPQQLTAHFNNCLVSGFTSTQLYIKYQTSLDFASFSLSVQTLNRAIAPVPRTSTDGDYCI